MGVDLAIAGPFAARATALVKSTLMDRPNIVHTGEGKLTLKFGRRRLDEQYTIEVVGDQIIQFYRRALAKP